MGLYQVVLTRRAEHDLEKIVRYIAVDNPEAAHRFGLELADAALSLSQPHIRQAGAHLPQRPGVRKLIHGSYLIFYRINDFQQKVRVQRFWHGAQDRGRLDSLEA